LWKQGKKKSSRMIKKVRYRRRRREKKKKGEVFLIPSKKRTVAGARSKREGIQKNFNPIREGEKERKNKEGGRQDVLARF